MKRLLALLMSLSMLLAAKGADADTTIYFVNIYAGPEIFELDGHAAIVVDIKGQPSRSYNFGVFDFDAPHFVYRFVKGDTDYMAVEWPTEPFLYPYHEQGRRVVAHELNFDSRQKSASGRGAPPQRKARECRIPLQLRKRQLRHQATPCRGAGGLRHRAPRSRPPLRRSHCSDPPSAM